TLARAHRGVAVLELLPQSVEAKIALRQRVDGRQAAAPLEGFDRRKHLTAVVARQLDQVVGGALEARSLPGERGGVVLVSHDDHCSAATCRKARPGGRIPARERQDSS